MSAEDIKAVAGPRRFFAPRQIEDAFVDEHRSTAVADRAQLPLGRERGWSC
jgi:hypothetical protein